VVRGDGHNHRDAVSWGVSLEAPGGSNFVEHVYIQVVSGGVWRPADSANSVRRLEAWQRGWPHCWWCCEGCRCGGLADEAARTKQDARIGGVDINAGDATACCFSFTMAGTNVT
jgi:hypothetical protein